MSAQPSKHGRKSIISNVDSFATVRNAIVSWLYCSRSCSYVVVPFHCFLQNAQEIAQFLPPFERDRYDNMSCNQFFKALILNLVRNTCLSIPNSNSLPSPLAGRRQKRYRHEHMKISNHRLNNCPWFSQSCCQERECMCPRHSVPYKHTQRQGSQPLTFLSPPSRIVPTLLFMVI